MILMPVGEENAAQFLAVLLQIRHIRDDQVNPQHVLIREGKPAVHGDHIVAVFDYGNIFADFVKPP